MAGMDFLRVNPGIETFQSGMDRAGRRRALDQETAQRDIEFRQQQDTDAALRRGIGAFYADDQPPVNQPAPPGVSAAAQPVAVPAPPPATFSAPPAANVADGFGDDPRLPPAQQGAPAAAPQAGPSFAAPAVRAAPARRGGAYADAIRALSKAPGGGRTMMALHGQDVQNQRADAESQRKIQHDGQVMWLKAVNDGDLKMAQHIGRQYGLQLPPDIYTNRQSLTDVRVATNLAKTMGITDDVTAVAFVDAYIDARQKGADEGTATRSATAAAKAGTGGPGKAVHWAVDKDQNVTGFDNRGNPIRTGVKARPNQWEVYGPSGAAGGGGSKQQQFAEWRIKTLVASGVPEKEAQKMVAGGTANRPLTAAQRLTAGNRLLSSTDRMGRKIYPNLDAALRAIDSAATGAGGPPAEPAAPAAPGAPGPGSAAPAAASNVVMFDPVKGTWSDGK